jgi:hypothetical protein
MGANDMSSGLPAGFTLDQDAPQAATPQQRPMPGLPQGFTLDEAPTPQAAPQAPTAQPQSFLSALGNIRMTDIVKGVYDAAKGGFDLPNDVIAGRVDPRSDEAIKRSFDAVSVFNPVTPASRFSLGGNPAPLSPVAQAAERTGIEIPTGIASESRVVQSLAQGARNAPVASAKMAQAMDNMRSGMTQAADDVVGRLGSGNKYVAGDSAKTGISDWITKTSKDITGRAYDAVDAAVNPQVTVPLSKTSEIASEIVARNAQSALPAGKAVSFLDDALSRPNGLNYEGIKGLRSRVGEMLTGRLESDISQAELKRIYGALTDDLGNAAKVAGGDKGFAAWQRANAVTKAVKGREEQLRKIIGEKADAPAEAVYQRLATYASSKAGGDLQKLAAARKAMPAGDWEEVGSAIVQNLGRDATGAVTPDRFVTAYGQMSDMAKNMLFGQSGAHRQALDDIMTISTRVQKNAKDFGNPSGTAQNAGFMAVAAGLLSAPLTTISAVTGGTVAAQMLAKPATASSMAKWARSYEAVRNSPTPLAISAFSRSSNNLASTMGDQFGRTFAGSDFMRVLSGPVRAPADERSDQQP